MLCVIRRKKSNTVHERDKLFSIEDSSLATSEKFLMWVIYKIAFNGLHSAIERGPLDKVAVLYSRSSTWLENTCQLHHLEDSVSYPSSSVCSSANGNDNINCIVGKTVQGKVKLSALQWQKLSSDRSADELLLLVLQLTFQERTISQVPCRKVAGRNSFSSKELTEEWDLA